MIGAYLLIYIPILLFVVAFLYETYLSFARILWTPKAGKHGYVEATWELTNTLLIFGVVMMFMLFTQSIDVLGSAIFWSTLLAGTVLLLRAICYIYIFYVKQSKKIGLIDWVFAGCHVVAAGLLVVTVIEATTVLATKNPPANLEFIPYFIPGLIFVLGLCAIPFVKLLRTK